MHLDQLGLADDQDRVPQRLDLVADEVEVEVAALDQELGAVAPSAFRQVERNLCGRRHGRPWLGHRADGGFRLLDGLQHALENELQPKSSGVHHAGVAEDGQLAWSLLDRGACAGGRRRDDARDVGVSRARGGRGGASSLARDGEDGAFGRLVDRPVRGVGRLFERTRQLGRGERALALDGASEAAEDLGEDDARVAARAHEAAV